SCPASRTPRRSVATSPRAPFNRRRSRSAAWTCERVSERRPRESGMDGCGERGSCPRMRGPLPGGAAGAPPSTSLAADEELDRRADQAEHRTTEGSPAPDEPASMAAAAAALEAEIDRFEALAATIRKMPLDSRKHLERAARTLQEAAG